MDKKIGQRLLDFVERHTDDITFNLKIKMNGDIHFNCYSYLATNDEEELVDTITGAITAIIKILQDSAHEELLEPFKIAVAKEFGVTKEEYYRRKRADNNEK